MSVEQSVTTAARSATVSVIIPCYNLGQYIDEAVDSVLAQTYQDFEILIVNDGSTDPATNARLGAYVRPRTRVFAIPENRGLPGARNLAIAHAQGRYLCALDADDRLDPRYFERAVPILDRRPELTFLSTWLRTFGDEEWEWTPRQCDLPTLLAECTVNGPSLVRRSAVVAVGGYDEGMREGNEDWDLWLRLVEQGHVGVILPEVLFYYRRRAGSLSTVCMNGPGHLRLMRALVTKHEAWYRRFLAEVLAHRDRETVRVLGEGDQLERELDARLGLEVDGLRRERDRLRAKLASGEVPTAPPTARGTGDEELANLRAAAMRAEQDIAALRGSLSWRITAPLRAMGGALRRLTRGD
jgi:glycosyltransferase involved in cell wall biosynthesis